MHTHSYHIAREYYGRSFASGRALSTAIVFLINAYEESFECRECVCVLAQQSHDPVYANQQQTTKCRINHDCTMNTRFVRSDSFSVFFIGHDH